MRRVLPLLLVATACATARTAPRPPASGAADVAFAPEEAKASPIDREVEGKNDEELFAIGTAAFGAGEFDRAAAAFARLADVFPASRHQAAALHQAGLSYERRDEWRLALERFRTLAREHPGPEAIEASFRIAECQYHLRELGDARATLDALAGREDVGVDGRIRALAQRGVVELEQGKPEDAERTLRLAVATWEGARDTERLDPYYPAQAQFYLGEVYREWTRAVRLDPSQADEARLRRDLEYKSEMLLSAQGHYLRAIRAGDDDWAVASGYRIGELYDELRAQLLDAPPPAGLDAAHAAAYRAELRRQLRVLATKAITAYEQTLSHAARAGVDDNRFLAEAQASLERMRRALAEESAGATPGDAGGR